MSKPPKFIQLNTYGHLLHALDEEGGIWEFNRIEKIWVNTEIERLTKKNV